VVFEPRSNGKPVLNTEEEQAADKGRGRERAYGHI